MSKRLVESVEEDPEKKQRPTVYAPEFFRRNTIQQATVKVGKQYKANDGKTRFVPPAVLGANNCEFMECMNPWGPDLLVLAHPPGSIHAKDRLTLDIHRKTAEAKEFRVVYRYKKEETEMTATETEDSFEIKGPDFELEIKGKRKEGPGEAICRRAKSAPEQLATITNDAMTKIEARINSFCPDFPLKWILFLNDGKWRMRFAADDDRYIHVDSVTYPAVTVKQNSIEITGSLDIVVYVSKPYCVIISNGMDRALEELKMLFTK